MRKEDPTVIKKLAPGKRHPRRIRIKAYKYWTRCHNTSEVSRQLKDDGYHVSIVTLNKWLEREDWEAREAVEKNELKRILRTSDDPVLRKLVMDDLEYVTVLRAIRAIIIKALKRPATRGLQPKTMKELLEVLKFLRNERELLLGAAEAKRANEPEHKQGNTTFIFNDQRKVNFAAKLNALPAAQRGFVLDQIGGVINQDSEEMAEVRSSLNGDSKAS